MTTYELPIIAAPSQRFTTSLSGKRCEFTISFNDHSGRWSFDLSIDGVPKLSGRRIVLGGSLVPASLGIGRLEAVDFGGTGAQPGRVELPSGAVRLIQTDEA